VIVESIEARALAIPFKAAFRHAAAERSETQTLWITAHANGAIGYGEGAPREYVTGESLETAAAFCAAHQAEWRASIRDLGSVRSWSERHRRDIDENPAAWAAVELALLDLLAKHENLSVESLLGLPQLAGRFRYTAVQGDAAPAQFAAQLAHYLAAGFRDFKVKLSGDTARDAAKVAALRTAGVSSRAVRADANNVWRDAEQAIAALEALNFGFRALEEPLQARDYGGMARVAEALDSKIILDESVTGSGELDRLPGAPARWIVNLRVSKMGGVLRSLQVAAALRRRGIGLIVGAHVGETSVLTRAALTVANAARDIVIAQEGAFGTHLLQRDVAEPPLMFGAAGVLDAAAAPLRGAGWGLAIDVPLDRLAPLSVLR
jgi:L-alanine-DL-glutamate epimerase-like enolase superfamily enzyme